MAQLRTATRQKAKIRLGLSAVSGGGKTYSALLIAYGMTEDWSKIAIIDTENGSADLYAHLGDYNVLAMTKYAPEDYIRAIKECEDAGMEVIIVDSITHEWEWCLQEQERLGGRYQDWAKVTPRHNAFVKSMIQSHSHIITTVRRKQDYDMTKDGQGKIKVEKAGLKEVTRDGWEYELTINLEMDVKHYATASKDRTGLFMDKPAFIPTPETGKMIKEWCETGIKPIVNTNNLDEQETILAFEEVQNSDTMQNLQALWESYPTLHANKEFCLLVTQKKKELATPKK